MLVRYETDQQGLMFVTRSWKGPVGKDLERRSRTLEHRAQKSVGVRSRRLQQSIETRKVETTKGLEVQVGSWTVPYAAAQHQGARPHVILPRPPKRFLVFTIAGRKIFTTRVQHPGNKPNPYLLRWLVEAVK